MLNKKDKEKLVKLPNELLSGYHARVMIKNAPERILKFYESNVKINADVVIVRSKDDEAEAAKKRNYSDKVLFVFGEEYWLTSYFSGVCQNIPLPKALLKRAST